MLTKAQLFGLKVSDLCVHWRARAKVPLRSGLCDMSETICIVGLRNLPGGVGGVGGVSSQLLKKKKKRHAAPFPRPALTPHVCR